MKNIKSQISVEYLVIVGLALAIIIPTSFLFYKYSQTSNEEAIRSQINKIGNSILTTSESVYGLGEGSVNTIELIYPKNIRDIEILNSEELIIRYELNSGISEDVFFSKIRISGNYTNQDIEPRTFCSPPCSDSTLGPYFPAAGKHRIRFESKNNYVLINTVN